MQTYAILFLLLSLINLTATTKLSLPTMKQAVAHANAIPTTTPKIITRKAKNHLPIAIQLQPQIFMPNLHVIPIHATHTSVELLSHNMTSIGHQQLIPILIPIHNYVPLHDLTVVPLQHVSKPHVVIHVEKEEEDPYRNPFGGYGVGWRFGGHGAGHGFHYSYG